MNNNLYCILLTSFASISTIIGYFVIYIKGNKNKIISNSLAFASGIMMCISIIDLIPSAFHYLNSFFILFKIMFLFLFILLGFFLSNFFDKHFFSINDSLYRVGIMSIISIILHNIPEGIITFMVSNINHDIGLKLAIAVAIHNIPEGISIAVPIYFSTKKKLKTFLLTFLSGVSELFGGLICLLFLHDGVSDITLGIIFAIISGIMLNIGIGLFSESRRYDNSWYYFIMGFIIMIISLII